MTIQRVSSGTSRSVEDFIQVGYLTYGLDRPLSGIGRYTLELGRALQRLDCVELTPINPYSHSLGILGGSSPPARLYGRLLPAMMTAAPLQLGILARRRRLDLVHDPAGISPFLLPRRFGAFARVVTIHDMVPFVFPETHQWLTNLLFRAYIPRTLPFVDRVITDSESSRRDIERFYRLPADRIAVIPCGVSDRFKPVLPERSRSVLRRYGIEPPYLLATGSLEPRKNLKTLFEAYAALRQRGYRQRLVVVGRAAWKAAEVFAIPRSLGLESEVHFTGYVEDDDLPAIYSGATAFVFPSIYEGFGLPPLEAMACGTPVVTSHASSLPEVVGDAGIMVDPLDVRSLSEALGRLLGDPAAHADYRARGLARASAFTWERSAREHLALYRDCIEAQAKRV